MGQKSLFSPACRSISRKLSDFQTGSTQKNYEDFGLAVPADFKGKAKPMLVDLMWERASIKYADLTPST